MITVCAWCDRVKLWLWYIPVRLILTHGICSRCRASIDRLSGEKDGHVHT